jgi:hypothetical protein
VAAATLASDKEERDSLRHQSELTLTLKPREPVTRSRGSRAPATQRTGTSA